jgi:chromosome segregation ATPase
LTAGEVIGSERKDFQRALDRRDAEIKLLRREVGALRSEVELKLKLKRELAAAQTEIAALRERAPSYESELNGLREELAKQQKIITRLRGEQSQLSFALKQLEAEQRQNHQRLKLTAIELTSVGSATREVLERLQADGFDLIGEVQPLSGLAS